MGSFLSLNTPAARWIREIENNHYQQLIAQRLADAAHAEVDLLNLQLSEAAQRRGKDAALLSSLKDIGDTLCDMASDIESIEAGVWSLNTLVEGWLSRISAQLKQHEDSLVLISQYLEDARGTAISADWERARLALSEEAGAAQGERSRERLRQVERQLRELVSDSAGERHYMAWFEIGWIRWKVDSNLPKAEEAFGRAVLFSETKDKAFFAYSLRHQAYMRYLQDNYEGAWETICESLRAYDELLARVDAAHYAAVTERREEMLDLARQCLKTSAVVIAALYSEPDFTPFNSDLEALEQELREEAGRATKIMLGRWERLWKTIHRLKAMAQYEFSIPTDLGHASVGKIRSRLDTADFAETVQFRSKASHGYRALEKHALDELRKEQERRSQEQEDAHRKLEQAESRITQETRNALIDKESKERRAASDRDSVRSVAPSSGISGVIGFCLTPFIWMLLLSIGYFDKHAFVAMITAFGIGMLGTMLVWAAINSAIASMQAASRCSSAQADYARAVHALEEREQRDIPSLRAALESAKARKRMVDQAIQVLQDLDA